MDDAMRLPRWLSRDRAEESRREQTSDVMSEAVMADLGRLTMQLSEAVDRIKDMADSRGDS